MRRYGLRDDNKDPAHAVCEARGDVATTSLIEVWIDETGSCSKPAAAATAADPRNPAA